MPDKFPKTEDEIVEMSEEEEIATICELRQQTIEDIRIGDNIPHVIIALNSGKVIFING